MIAIWFKHFVSQIVSVMNMKNKMCKSIDDHSVEKLKKTPIKNMG